MRIFDTRKKNIFIIDILIMLSIHFSYSLQGPVNCSAIVQSIGDYLFRAPCIWIVLQWNAGSLY